MPWQQLVADVGGEYRLDERGQVVPFYREVVVTVPRQSGKTTLVLSWEVQRTLGWQLAQRVAYTAQTGWDARKKLIDDQAPILMRSPLSPTVRQVLRGAGNEGISFHNGSRIDVMATSESAGHGRTVDLGVIDEAFSDTDARREQAILPAMATRRAGQLLVVSTAGTDASLYLIQKVANGRLAVDRDKREGIAYFEWSADADADIDNHDTWWSCMPALGHTISIEVVQHARQTMSEGEFRRAFLNQWTATEQAVIPAVTWEAACTDRDAPDAGIAIGVAMDHDRGGMSVVVAGKGREQVVELVDNAGLEAIAKMARQFRATVLLDSTGPEASLEPELVALNATVRKLSASEVADACGAFYDDIADRKLRIRRHMLLDQAVTTARKQPTGDKWRWMRRDGAPVAPLVAATLAHWGSTRGKPKRIFAY